MKKMHFSVDLNAPKEKVWNVLWGKDTYPGWTSVFSEGSRAETDWQEGSRVLFLAANGDGMSSRIERSIPNEYMSFKHLGMLKDGKEVQGPEAEKWAGAMENYTLKDAGGHTTLTVDVDITEEYEGYFQETFPKALGKVKELSEN